MKREAVARLTGEHSVRACCRAMGISRSSYYESAKSAGKREEAERPIVEAINDVHKHRYKRFYGSPRMSDELASRGHTVTRHQTARIMRKHGIKAETQRRFVRTTDSKHKEPIAENLLARDFNAGNSASVWCADITYLRTTRGWLYLAAILNLRTRKWVGYAVDVHMKNGLVNSALDMALLQEGESPEMIHTDRGSQYASQPHRKLLALNNISLSMSRKGNCWDNAPMESFFGTFKNEVGDTFLDKADANAAIFDYQAFYNRERRHSALNNQSPMQFESDLKKVAA